MSNVTLKEIASVLGVSATTISRALNDKPDISKETKERILNIIKDLNYTPNTSAINFRAKRSKIIGIVVPKISYYFFSEAISGAIEAANPLSYSTIICESQHVLKKEQESINNLIASNVDGIIVSPSNKTSNLEHFNPLKDKNIPFVIFDKISSEYNGSKVISDDFKGAEKIVQYLIDTGCNKIAHIQGAKASSNAKRRLEGYRHALKKNNIKINNKLICQTEQVTVEAGLRLTNGLINSKEKFDAIFAITDEVAVGAIKALKRNNIRIPQDVSVAGFSNSILSSVIEPSLTTVQQPAHNIGETAMKLLIDKIKTGGFQDKTIIMNTELIIRESTKNI